MTHCLELSVWGCLANSSELGSRGPSTTTSTRSPPLCRAFFSWKQSETWAGGSTLRAEERKPTRSWVPGNGTVGHPHLPPRLSPHCPGIWLRPSAPPPPGTARAPGRLPDSPSPLLRASSRSCAQFQEDTPASRTTAFLPGEKSANARPRGKCRVLARASCSRCPCRAATGRMCPFEVKRRSAPPRVPQSALSASVFALSQLKDWESDREVWPAFSELSQGSCSQTPGSGCVGSLEPLSIWFRAKDPSFLLVFSPCPFHTPPPSPNFSVIIYRVLLGPGPLLGAGDSEKNKVPGNYYNQDTIWERLDEQKTELERRFLCLLLGAWKYWGWGKGVKEETHLSWGWGEGSAEINFLL